MKKRKWRSIAASEAPLDLIADYLIHLAHRGGGGHDDDDDAEPGVVADREMNGGVPPPRRQLVRHCFGAAWDPGCWLLLRLRLLPNPSMLLPLLMRSRRVGVSSCAGGALSTSHCCPRLRPWRWRWRRWRWRLLFFDCLFVVVVETHMLFEVKRIVVVTAAAATLLRRRGHDATTRRRRRGRRQRHRHDGGIALPYGRRS